MTVNDEDIGELINAELVERRAKAMLMRNMGATLQTIAKETRVSIGTVRKDLAIVRRDINNESPTDVIARHRAVVFDIQRANYPKMIAGDKDAAMVILRALEREAKLLGLDQPVKLLASVSNEDFANEAARLIERINELDPATLKELERGHRRDQVIDAETVESAPADGDTRDSQPADGAALGDGRIDLDTGLAEPVEVLGPWRPGQPGPDPSAEPDTAGAVGELQGPAGSSAPAWPAVDAAGNDGAAGLAGADDDDDDWSNI